MPNFDKIARLRDRLVEQEKKASRFKRFIMADWFHLINRKGRMLWDIAEMKPTPVSKVRKNGAACGSAACLAGETAIEFAPGNWTIKWDTTGIADTGCLVGGHDMRDYAMKALELDDLEASYMFTGRWQQHSLTVVTREQAIQYLNKVIATKNVYADIYRELADLEEQNA